MSSASIIITQDGVAGAPGISRDDLVLAQPVTLTNANNTGVRSWRWRLKDRPTGSAATLSNSTQAQCTFTPDVAGSYLVELIVDAGRQGQIDTRIAAVRETINGIDVRWIAAGEDSEANWDGNTRGWMPDFELLVEAMSAGGMADHASTHLPGGDDAITTAAAVELTDSTNAEGAAASFARSNHTHAHGNRSGGSLHSVVVASGAAGFMSGTDKAKLDGIETGAVSRYTNRFDIDCTAQATNDWNAGGDGSYSLGGFTWEVLNTDNADTLGPVFGTGLRYNASTNSRTYHSTTRDATRFRIPITTLIPTWDANKTYLFEVYLVSHTLTANNRFTIALDWDNSGTDRMFAGGRRNSGGLGTFAFIDAAGSVAGQAVAHDCVAIRVNAHGVMATSGNYAAGFPAQYQFVGGYVPVGAAVSGSPMDGSAYFTIAYHTGEAGGNMDVTIARIRGGEIS